MKTTIAAGTIVTTTTTNTNVATKNVTTSIPSITITPKTETQEGNLQQFQTPIGAAPIANSLSPNNNNNANKRPISLDLNKSTAGKKQRLVAPLIVDSPDLQNMKTLNTPDLEKILLASNMLQTPQPGLVFPTKIGAVTSEQEAFGKGFEEALHSLHNSKNSQQVQLNTSTNNIINNNAIIGTAAVTAATGVTTTTTAAGAAAAAVSTGMSGGSFVYTNLENFPVAIKDEPQNPPSPTAVSPIDMETQEKIKLERKRQRNRVAASKCRKRKLERISKLEDKVKLLKFENTDLGAMVKTLKDMVAQLKQQVMEHIGSGCSINEPNNGISLLQGK